MRVFYGADPSSYDPADEVELKVLRTLKYGRSAYYDSSGQESLLGQWTIEVIALLNPRATSYGGEVGVGPIPLADQRALATDRAIRHRMLEHRRVLRVVSDEVNQAAAQRELLRSPAAHPENPQYPCDSRGGPYPQAFDIIGVIGQPRTLVVYWRCVTYVNECAQYDNNVVLSHRWRQRNDVDVDHFSVRITEGEVVFDMAELDRLGRYPDQYRGDFCHPVPDNFQREHVSVTALEDGTKVMYTVVDREKSHLLNPGLPATRIEAYHTEGVHIPSPHIAFNMGLRGGLAIAAKAAGKAGIDPVKAAGVALEAGLSAGILAIDMLLAGLPKASSHVFCRVWGDRNSSRQDLGNMALNIVFGRLTDFRLLLLPSVEFSLTRDLNGKFAEANLVLTHPPGVFSIFASMAATLAMVTDNETITPPFSAVNIISTGDGQNPAFPNARQSRGTWVGNIVAQLLDPPCSVPAAPVNRNEAEYTFRS